MLHSRRLELHTNQAGPAALGGIGWEVRVWPYGQSIRLYARHPQLLAGKEVLPTDRFGPFRLSTKEHCQREESQVHWNTAGPAGIMLGRLSRGRTLVK